MNKTRKNSLSYLKAIGVFLVLECILVIISIMSCNYNRVKADETNIEKLVIQPTKIERDYSVRGADTIRIIDENRVFRLFWQGDYARKYELNSKQLAELLSQEHTLSIEVKKKDASIVGLQGNGKVYLAIEDYNLFHKKNCSIAIVVLSVFQFILLAFFIPLIIVLIKIRN